MLLKSTTIALFLVAVAEARFLQKRGCQAQSCIIANLAGSTGEPYEGEAVKGGTEAGLKCIAGYNPAVANVTLGGGKRSIPIFPERDASYEAPHVKRALYTSNDLVDGTCHKYFLIFARGTTEVGNMGETVGPALQEGLELSFQDWGYQGVTYDATVDGDDCLGLPGGAAGTKLLEMAQTKCPDSKIVVSGYSEGAMVAHNAVGYASDAAKANVVGVVVFGDPFNGAPIKGYDSSKIKTYCISGDEVCSGEFTISLNHLSYTLVDTDEAVSYIKGLV